MPPSPRERHNAGILINIYIFNQFKKLKTKNCQKYQIFYFLVVHDHSIFIFGGFDGNNKLNDFYEFNTDNDTWQEVIYSGSGMPPSPRKSATCIVFGGSMYIFGGNDGQCKSDLFKFNFETNTWFEIKKNNNAAWPKERHKSSAVIYKNLMIIYGGHDGTDVLEDLWSFDLSIFIK